jgi:hypothetical protein
MDEEQNQRSGNMMTGMVFALLPILYVLSLGPAVWGVEKMGWDPDLWETIYQPLIWLHENTFLEEPLDWYVELFVP